MPALIVLVALGLWQVERLAWKLDLISQREAALAAPARNLAASGRVELGFSKVRVVGRFAHDQEVHLVAPPRRGRLGYHIITPLARGGAGPLVLVDRGWVPTELKNPNARPQGLHEGKVAIVGYARKPGQPGWFTPDNEPQRNIWYWLDVAAIAQQRGLDLLPLIIEADAAPNPGGYPVGGQTRISLPNNHLGYAITWFGLAAGLVAGYIAFHWRRKDLPL